MKFIILILAVLFFSCGPNYHLKMSNKHLNKAILKGAKVRSDTVYTVVPFKFPGATYMTTLSTINVKDTIIISGEGKKSIKTKLKITLKKGCPDDCIEKVYIKTDCPDVEGEVTVPTSVSNTVVTPRGFWYYLRLIGLPLFLLGFAVRHFGKTIVNFLLRFKPG